MGQLLSARTVLVGSLLGFSAAVAASGCGSTADSNKGTGGSNQVGGSSEGGSAGDNGTPAGGGGTDDGSGGDAGGSELGGKGGTGGSAGTFAGGRSSGGFETGGGRFTFGGFVSSGGSAGSGGTLGSGGSTPASGGGSSCLVGAPCKCDDRVGITECKDGEASCSCPPAEQCAAEKSTTCFEPCGGEPFGTWVLEDACLGDTDERGLCTAFVKGKLGASDFRIRILDGGQLDVSGTESWDVEATVPLSCQFIFTVNSCSQTSFNADSFPFAYDQTLSCQANDCGVCDCAQHVDAGVDQSHFWTRSGTELTLDGFRALPYCVDGDELWLGGKNGKSATAAYKFKKQSCTGTPLKCSARSKDECAASGDCFLGTCKPKSGTGTRCSMASTDADCGVLQGCIWDPEGCSGPGAEACDFTNCGKIPGCTWGPPKAYCAGENYCSNHAADDCTMPGCSVTVCQPLNADYSDCQRLSAAECAKAAGCTVNGTACSGQALCVAQKDKTICAKLGCAQTEFCDGVPERRCADLSVDECQNEPGCQILW